MNVDIIIPVYNSLEYLTKLLNSCEQLKFPDIDLWLYLVDDASKSETKDFLEGYAHNSRHVRLIRNDKNLGYTKALNRGIRAGRSEFVMQVNSDCILSSRSVVKLVTWLNKDPDLFAVSPLSNAASWQSIPLTLNPSGEMAINSMFDDFSVDDMDKFCELYGSGLAEGQLLNGFCVMYRRNLLDKIGLPDETAFPRGYGEEDDLHIRAANKGLKLGVATNTYVYHAKTKSFSNTERTKLAKEGRIVLNQRYGDSRIKRLAASMKRHPRLESIRVSATHIFSNYQCIDPVKAFLNIDWSASLQNRSQQLSSIIMPVHAHGRMTVDAIASIYKNTPDNFELIVVNNGADQDCESDLKKVQETFGFKLIILPENLFFSMGCNIGFISSCGDKVVFVNNDMIFNNSGWLSSICHNLDKPDVGAAGIKLLYDDYSIQSAGLMFSKKSFFPIEYMKKQPGTSLSGCHFFPAITGACIGIRAVDFAQLYGFDPLYVNGSEDIDLCLKVNYILGNKCIIDADVNAVHLESKSPKRGLYVKNNRILFYQRWSGYISSLTTDFSEPIEPSDHFPSPIRMYKQKTISDNR